MLAVAKAANASNETLYRWYGNKRGLFTALVARNAGQVRRELERALGDGDEDPAEVLGRFGPMLLAMVTSDRAVLLNRVAAAEADPSPELGQALAAAGREVVFRLVARLFERIGTERLPEATDSTVAATVYLDLLLGDLQVRRVTGAMPTLSEADILERSARAWRLTVRCFGGVA